MSTNPSSSALPLQVLSLISAHALSSAGFFTSSSLAQSTLTTSLHHYILLLSRLSVENANLATGRSRPSIEDVIEILEEEFGVEVDDLETWVEDGEWGRLGDGENAIMDGLEGLRLQNESGLESQYPRSTLPSLPPELVDPLTIPLSPNTLTLQALPESPASSPGEKSVKEVREEGNNPVKGEEEKEGVKAEIDAEGRESPEGMKVDDEEESNGSSGSDSDNLAANLKRQLKRKRSLADQEKDAAWWDIRIGLYHRVKALEELDDGDAWGGVLPPLPGTEGLVEEWDEDEMLVKKEDLDGMDVDGEEGSEMLPTSAAPTPVAEADGAGEEVHIPEQALEAMAVSTKSAFAAYTMEPIPFSSSTLSASHSQSHISRFHKRLRTRDAPPLYPSTLPSLLEAYETAKKITPEQNRSQSILYRKQALEIMSDTTADPLLYERAGTTLTPVVFGSTSGATPKGNPFVPSYPIYGNTGLPVNAAHEQDRKVPEEYPTRTVSIAAAQNDYLSRGMDHPPPSTINPLEPHLMKVMLAELPGNASKPDSSKTPYLTPNILAELSTLRAPPPLKSQGDERPALYGEGVFAPGQLDAEGQAKAKKLQLQKEKTLKLKLKLTLGGGGGGGGNKVGDKGKGKETTSQEEQKNPIYLGATWDVGLAGDWSQWRGLSGVEAVQILSSGKGLDLPQPEGTNDEEGNNQPGSGSGSGSVSNPSISTPKIRLRMPGSVTPSSETPLMSGFMGEMGPPAAKEINQSGLSGSGGYLEADSNSKGAGGNLTPSLATISTDVDPLLTVSSATQKTNEPSGVSSVETPSHRPPLSIETTLDEPMTGSDQKEGEAVNDGQTSEMHVKLNGMGSEGLVNNEKENGDVSMMMMTSSPSGSAPTTPGAGPLKLKLNFSKAK